MRTQTVQPGGKGYLLQTESVGVHPKWQASVDGSERVLSESADRHVHDGTSGGERACRKVPTGTCTTGPVGLSESADRHVHDGNKHCIVPPLGVDHTLR